MASNIENGVHLLENGVSSIKLCKDDDQNGKDANTNGTVPATTNGVKTKDVKNDSEAQLVNKNNEHGISESKTRESKTRESKTSESKTRESKQAQEIPQKVIYKDKTSGPCPTINLGVWGKIPVHSMCDMYIDTADGCMLTFSQAKMSRSIGGWVYAGAACLAKYLEDICFTPQTTPQQEQEEGEGEKKKGCLSGKRVIELGAGTGVVGIMAGYHGADTIITDMDNIVPLIQYNIDQNQANMKGRVEARGLVWGEDAADLCTQPVDYLILANCVYYESSLEPLAETMKQLASADTEILVCYEERTQGIKALVARWHDVIAEDFEIHYLPNSCICEEFKEDYVRLLRMKKKKT